MNKNFKRFVACACSVTFSTSVSFTSGFCNASNESISDSQIFEPTTESNDSLQVYLTSKDLSSHSNDETGIMESEETSKKNEPAVPDGKIKQSSLNRPYTETISASLIKKSLRFITIGTSALIYAILSKKWSHSDADFNTNLNENTENITNQTQTNLIKEHYFFVTSSATAIIFLLLLIAKGKAWIEYFIFWSESDFETRADNDISWFQYEYPWYENFSKLCKDLFKEESINDKEEYKNLLKKYEVKIGLDGKQKNENYLKADPTYISVYHRKKSKDGKIIFQDEIVNDTAIVYSCGRNEFAPHIFMDFNEGKDNVDFITYRYRGCFEPKSNKNTVSTNAETIKEDAKAVYNYLKKKGYKKVILHGYSLGGSPAAYMAKLDDLPGAAHIVKGLFLRSPIVELSTTIKNFAQTYPEMYLGKSSLIEKICNFPGWIAKKFFSSNELMDTFSDLNSLSENSKENLPIFLASGDSNDFLSLEKTNLDTDLIKKAHFKKVSSYIQHNANHNTQYETFSCRFANYWENIVIGDSIDFLPQNVKNSLKEKGTIK